MTDEPTATQTRLALQAVAEHVLSAALHAATGKVGLRSSPGGFTTPLFPSDHGERQVRVDGTELVVTDDRGERRAPLTTVRAAAELAEVTAGAPADVYTPATPLDLDAPLVIDADVAAGLAAWWELVSAALEGLRVTLEHLDPPIVQLWPEHFDVAATIGEVNYGGSPGDATHPAPYLYVGPWTPPPADDLWNEPFGASAPASAIPTIDEATAFFHAANARLGR